MLKNPCFDLTKDLTLNFDLNFLSFLTIIIILFFKN